MKSGTTTLYFDLLHSDRIFFPQDKEPNSLCSDWVLTAEGREAYAALFQAARGEQLCGDASTGYTQYPRHSGSAERARHLLPQSTTILYIVRDPIDRIISHYRHEWSRKAEQRSLFDAVKNNPEYTAFSKYAMQFDAWRRAFPETSKVVEFSRLETDRLSLVDEIAATLGIPPISDQINVNRVDNASSERHYLGSAFRRLQQSTLYRSAVRPLTTPTLRRAVRQTILRRAPQVDPVVSERFIHYVLDCLSADLARHEEVLGESFWDYDTLYNRHIARLKS